MRDYERLKCGDCGVFVSYGADSYTPYGCASYDPPEPYDPVFLCDKHSEELYREYLNDFRSGSRTGDWGKSEAELKAAQECGLAWVGSSGVGVLGTNYFADAHQYISQSVYDTLSKLPYYGWCMTCGAERKGGYCGDDKCIKSFARKAELTPHSSGGGTK